MSTHIKATNHNANEARSGNCWAGLGIIQIALGVLLVTASAYGYSLLQHAATIISALMGAALLFNGARAFLVCRASPQFHDHHHQTG
jgi:hypothetical protein